jgi:DNA gyrase subunit A
MAGYQTITKRKKLIKAYSNKSPIVSAMYIKEDTELVLVSTAGRHLLVNTAAISPKTTKDTAGVNVLTVKKYHKLQSVRQYREGEFAKPHRYRTKTLPAAGALLSSDDTGEQLQLSLE